MIRIVFNRLLGGWYVVRGAHQTPLCARFETKADAQAWLSRSTKGGFDNSTFRKLVTQFGGWIESGVARFPSVHQKDQFLKALDAARAKK